MQKSRRQFILTSTTQGLGLGLASMIPSSFAQTNPKSINSTPMNSTFKDTEIRDPSTGRVIGIRIRLPEKKQSSGLIIYSPGLGSGFSNGAHWCDTWQAAGFVVATLSHPVTNDVIWDTSKTSFNANLQAALAGLQYNLRVSDCKYAISACLKSLGIEAYIDPQRIGIAGHSFGALTVQSISGQLGTKDARIQAAIAFSPGALPKERAKTMSQVRIPFMCVTGQHDHYVTFNHAGHSKKLGVPLENRLAVYEYLPKGQKYLLKLNEADHMSFSGENMDAEKFSREIKVTNDGNLHTWKKVSAVTTLFWHQHLHGSAQSGLSKEELNTQMRRALDEQDLLEIA